jgi:hypothetical protein
VIVYEYWYSNTDRDIYYSYSIDNGNNWVTHLTLDDDFDDERFPVIASDHYEGTFYSSWYDDDDIQYTQSENIQFGWEELLRVNSVSNASDDDFPAVSGINGDGISAWIADGNGYDVLFDNSIFVGIETDNGTAYHCNLHGNYPNPFNPTTTIPYAIAKPGQIDISIYNIAGQKVAILESGFKTAGDYKAVWDATGFASGVYLVRLSQGKQHAYRKILLVK